MNLSAASDKISGYVLLSLYLPGLHHLTPACAKLIGQLLQETFEVDLVAKLILPRVSKPSESVFEDMRRATAARLQAPTESGGKTTPASRFAADVTRRLGGEPLPCFAHRQDQLHFTFLVNDVAAAEQALASEVCRLGFSEMAEINRYCEAERRCQLHHPKTPTGPSMAELCVEVLRGAGLLPA